MNNNVTTLYYTPACSGADFVDMEMISELLQKLVWATTGNNLWKQAFGNLSLFGIVVNAPQWLFQLSS